MMLGEHAQRARADSIEPRRRIADARAGQRTRADSASPRCSDGAGGSCERPASRETRAEDDVRRARGDAARAAAPRRRRDAGRRRRSGWPRHSPSLGVTQARAHRAADAQALRKAQPRNAQLAATPSASRPSSRRRSPAHRAAGDARAVRAITARGCRPRCNAGISPSARTPSDVRRRSRSPAQRARARRPRAAHAVQLAVARAPTSRRTSHIAMAATHARSRRRCSGTKSKRRRIVESAAGARAGHQPFDQPAPRRAPLRSTRIGTRRRRQPCASAAPAHADERHRHHERMRHHPRAATPRRRPSRLGCLATTSRRP